MADERDPDGFYTGPGNKTFTLTTPVKRDGADALTAITLNEPTGKQLVLHAERVNQTNDDGISAMLFLISMCSGVVLPDVEAMRQRDIDRCSDWLQLFTRPRKPA